MTTMSVPSTLVKCLYLFFDLPHMTEASEGPTQQPPAQEKTPGQGHPQPELPLADRRALLQKVFVQVRWARPAPPLQHSWPPPLCEKKGGNPHSWRGGVVDDSTCCQNPLRLLCLICFG